MVRTGTDSKPTKPSQKWEFNHEYFTNGEGSHPYALKYLILDHLDANQICVWNNHIVTASKDADQSKICVWDTSGKLLHKIIHGINSMLVWDNILITGSSLKLEYWRVEKTHKMKVFFSSETPIYHLIWNNLLYALSEASRIIVWDKNGKIVRTVTKVERTISASIIVNGFLWTASPASGIKIWKQKSDRGMEIVKSSTDPDDRRVHGFFQWKEDRIVASYGNPHQPQVLDAKGEKVSTLPLKWSLNCAIWQGKMLVASSDLQCFLISDDGLVQSIQPVKDRFTYGTKILSYDGKVWMLTSKYIVVWSLAADWKVQRLLWLAFKKNAAPECQLACLPRELILFIISLLNHT